MWIIIECVCALQTLHLEIASNIYLPTLLFDYFVEIMAIEERMTIVEISKTDGDVHITYTRYASGSNKYFQ